MWECLVVIGITSRRENEKRKTEKGYFHNLKHGMILLDRTYFERNDVVFLAKDLLGKLIVTDFGKVRTSAWITETEAYRAPEDKASHAYGNRRTKRTETMFGHGGHAYVYLNYGIHHLFNIVTGPKETAHAVLIRGIMPFENALEQMKRRKKAGDPMNVLFYNGPGKLTQGLGIRTGHNGLDLCAENSPVRVYDRGLEVSDQLIKVAPRIGIGYAEEWVGKPWRFLVNDHRLFMQLPGVCDV
jgi:DNA-3-methyladenine glycosylase